MLIHGNVDEATAHNLAQVFTSNLQLTALLPSEVPTQRVVHLPPRSHTSFYMPGPVQQNPNSAIEVVFQIGEEAPLVQARLGLLAHLGQELCFNTLRTEQQLGYIVHMGTRNDAGIVALRIIVQSTKADPVEIDSCIEAFLVKFRALLVDMSPEVYASNVQACVAKQLKEDQSLLEESKRWYSEVASSLFAFRRSQDVAASMQTTGLEEVLGFFDKYVVWGGEQRRKLMVGVFSSQHWTSFSGASESDQAASGSQMKTSIMGLAGVLARKHTQVRVHNMDAFKKAATLYPVVAKPFPKSSSL